MATRLLGIILLITICYQKIDSARICVSCTGLSEDDNCQHFETCQKDEVCYTQKYKTQENITKYDLGCSYPQLCRKNNSGIIFGKRVVDHSHVICHRCCNDTNICNSELSCENNFKVPKQSCLSCSEVESPVLCKTSVECIQDEVCYVHKYITETYQQRYDLGCKHSSFCLNSYSSHAFGRRTSIGRHLLCESCCLGSNNCNSDLQCSQQNLKSINESCTSTNDCKNNLICDSGICRCPSVDYYWKYETCNLRKDINEICTRTFECKELFVCLDNQCKCSTTEFWNGTKCSLRQKYNSFCKLSEECSDTLYCVHGSCKCDRIDYWTGHNCTSRKEFNNSCIATADCKEQLLCLNNRCSCHLKEFWNGTTCGASPKECNDIRIVKDGVYTIYPAGDNQPIRAYCIIEDNKKWTVIQRRDNKIVDFYTTWNEYKVGFGDPNGEYWLGNENIHLISSNGRHQIRIKLEHSIGQKAYADYSIFSVGNEASKYVLNITGYSGTAGDSLDNVSIEGKANGQRFSTKDQDNDASSLDCANERHGGWWYSNCAFANINAKGDVYHPNWAYSLGNIDKSLMMITKSNL